MGKEGQGPQAEMIPIIEVSKTPVAGASDPTPVVEAPVTVVPPGTLTTPGAAGAGATVGHDVEAGRDFVGRDSTRYNSPGSSVNFLSPDNAALWQANMKLLQDIADVATRLDDIPGRLSSLEKTLHTPAVAIAPTGLGTPASQQVLIALIVLIGIALLFGGLLLGWLLFGG